MIPASILQNTQVSRAVEELSRQPLPFYGCSVAAGFPSPADDYLEKTLDANELLIANPLATYFVRVRGQSMQGCWIRDGDVAVVDTSRTPAKGDVIVAVLDGEMLIKQLDFDPEGRVRLCPSNKRYPVIEVREEQDFLIWGVVTWTIHRQAGS